MTDKGSLIVVSGPSGSGKGTILNEFNQKYKDEYMTYSISATTRSPREGEMDGINYYFITTDEFKNKISNESPLGKALIGGKAGETVTVKAPQGDYKVKIVSIED